MNQSFKTIQKEETYELIEKKSKFIAAIFHVNSVEEAEEKLDEIRRKYHDAKHHCYAYRIVKENQLQEKASDDGEPSGTAGAPMLQLLSQNELINVLVIVTRYFGGILLGTGGLVRAYTQVTKEVIQKTKILEQQFGQVLKVPISYSNLAYFQYYCNKNNIPIIKINFEENPCIILEVTLKEKEKILQEIQEKQFDIQKVEIMQEKYLFRDSDENR